MEKKEIENVVDLYKDEMIETLAEFVSINTIYDENSVDKKNPFGRGVSRGLEYFYNLAKKDGFDVINYDNAGSLPEKIGTIPIVQFDSPESLERGHNNKMVVTDESGNPRIVKENQNIKQYATEVSNTNIYDELSDLMRLNTSMIASMNLMKVADDMYNKAINIRE